MVNIISRAVILHAGKILFIHRFYQNKEYFVLPGGHVEEGESEEDALIREIKEETSLTAKIGKKLWTLVNPYDKSKNHFFLIKEFSGKLKLSGPEAERNSKSNKYVLEWRSLKEVPGLTIFPEPIKPKIIKEFLK